MLAFKPEVRLRATPFIIACLVTLTRLSDELNETITITSVNDYKLHNPDSKHYTDEAIDVRTRGMKSGFFEKVKQQFVKDITVLDEGDHIHIQIRKGL